MKIIRSTALILSFLIVFFVSNSFGNTIELIENHDKDNGYDHTAVAFYLWRQINNLRHNPVQTMLDLELDVENIRERLGTEAWILDRTLAPLALDLRLYTTASSHIQDMKKNSYFGYVSPVDPIPLNVKIAETGYMASEVGESLGALSFNSYLEFIEAVNMILANMIKDELFASNPYLRLFSETFTEIGLSVDLSLLTFGDGKEIRAYVVVINYAKPIHKRSFVIGNVMQETDDSKLFPTDTVNEFTVKYRGTMFFSTEQIAGTPFLGAYQFPRVSSYYMTLTAVKDSYIEGEIYFSGKRGNLLKDIIVSQ